VHPLVTVIMPIRNEAGLIRRSLGAVLAQDYPSDRLEILVVDGMSEDGTREIVQDMLAAQDGARLLDNPSRTAPAALNVGLCDALGEVIVRVDGHTCIAGDYISCCIAALAATEADCVGGMLHTANETAVARSIALAQSSPFGVGNAHFRTGVGSQGRYVDTVAFGAYRREVFDKIGQFDEELVRNQDDEFNYRLRAAGGRIWLDPSIRSTYYARSSLRSLWKQYYQYGYWKVRVFQKVSGSARLRHWAPPMFVLGLVGGLPLAAGFRLLRILYTAGLALYLVATIAASLRIAMRAGFRHLLRLPPAFATLHLAYGLGLWVGLLRFGPPWRQEGRDG
jgi:succinoglycan biosynthesis protein ExoA